MTFSLNNRLILEQYVPGALKPKIMGGIATPDQKEGLKGLRVLVGTVLSDGRKIPKGSTAYIREEVLYTQPWAKKILSCDTISEKFMIVDTQYIELVDTPDSPNDAA